MTSHQRLIDCDVHCVPPSIDDLRPFLSDHWSAFLDESGFKAPVGLGLTYPSWSGMIRTLGEATTLQAVTANVLNRAELAILHSYAGVESLTHPFLANAIATAVNRWVEENYLRRDPRLFATIAVNPQDTAGAIEEIERCASNSQYVGVLLPVRSSEPYGSRRYWPIWEIAVDRQLVLAITYGGSPGVPPTPVGWFDSLFEDYAVEVANYQAQVVSLVMSGLLQRLPEMRIAVLESGWTWMPSVMWRSDREWKGLRREVPWVEASPSEYMRRHVRLSTSPTDHPADFSQFASLLEHFPAEEMLMYSSDYPHAYGASPDAVLEQLPAGWVERVGWDNAWDCWGLASRVGARPDSIAV